MFFNLEELEFADYTTWWKTIKSKENSLTISFLTRTDLKFFSVDITQFSVAEFPQTFVISWNEYVGATKWGIEKIIPDNPTINSPQPTHWVLCLRPPTYVTKRIVRDPPISYMLAIRPDSVLVSLNLKKQLNRIVWMWFSQFAIFSQKF